jgi:hypothetical protein
MFKMSSLPRHLLAASIVLIAAFVASSVSALTLSVVGPASANPGEMVTIQIVTDEAIDVGSTDINLNWDIPGLVATAASTSVLSGFTANIDNGANQVRTASAAVGADMIPAGSALFEVAFTVPMGSDGTTFNIFITDADGTAPDDLAGPVPPIPPVSIPYESVAHDLTVVPEPGTAMLLLGPLAGLALRSSTRRSRAQKA